MVKAKSPARGGQRAKRPGPAPQAPRSPRARNAHGRQRQRLIDACISALHMHGPSRTTVEKVVAIAKMSPGIVRFYFDSKAAMLVASLQFLAAEFEERLLGPVALLKARPVAALELMVDLYLDPDIASPRKVSVWYAFWGEASSRQEYYDICGQKDESFAALVRDLIGRLIAETGQAHLDPDGIALGLIGVLEILWQDFAFRSEPDIDRVAAKRRCMAYLRSVFPGRFPGAGVAGLAGAAAPADRLPAWSYADDRIFAWERERLWRDAWSVVGHESDIAHAGDFATEIIGAERVVVVRDRAGAVHALRNNCPEAPHAVVAPGSGRFSGYIQCRVHGLEFDLDGRRAAAVIHGGSADHGDLLRLDVQVIGGLIFVRAGAGATDGAAPRHLHAAPALPDWFDDAPRGLLRLGTAHQRPVNADWKVVVEQWLASAPVEGLRETTQSLSWHTAPWAGAAWSARAYRSIIAGGERAWLRHFLAPNHLIESRVDGVSVFQVLSAAPGRSLLRQHAFTAPAVRDTHRALRFLGYRLGGVCRESDIVLAESIQQGYRAFGYGVAAGRPVPRAVAWFRHLLMARIPALTLDRQAFAD